MRENKDRMWPSRTPMSAIFYRFGITPSR